MRLIAALLDGASIETSGNSTGTCMMRAGDQSAPLINPFTQQMPEQPGEERSSEESAGVHAPGLSQQDAVAACLEGS